MAVIDERVSIRLGHSLASMHSTLHNGPGWRVALWVQGCSLLCTETCLNQHLLSPHGGFLFSVEEVAQRIDEIRTGSADPVEGITVLGGEPTDQALALVPLFAAAHGMGLSTMLYSGFVLNSLRASKQPAVQALLRHTDLLVDGPFLQRQYSDRLAWRGSKNQKLRCLSDRYTETGLQEAFRRQGKGFSLAVSSGGLVSVSGLQDRVSASRIEEMLRPEDPTNS